MEGRLSKKSKGKGLSTTNQWTERYYILNEDTKELNCYQETKGKKTYRGQVNIDKAYLTNCSDAEKPYSFELTAKNSSDLPEVMILAAPTSEEMVQWITAICRVAPCTADWMVTTSTPSSTPPSSTPVPVSTAAPSPTPAPVAVPVPVTVTHVEPDITDGSTVAQSTKPDQKEDLNTISFNTRSEILKEKVNVELHPTPNQPQQSKSNTEVIEKIEVKEDHNDEDTTQNTINDTQRGAPFLRGSSGYDFGNKVQKTWKLPEPILEEIDSQNNDSIPIVIASPHSLNQISDNQQQGDFSQHTERPQNMSSLTMTDNSSLWEFTCLCKNILPRIGNKLLKRCRLFHQLFPNCDSFTHGNMSNRFDFQFVKEMLISEYSTYSENAPQISLSFPYLPSSGCNWSDILRYLRFTERNQQQLHQTEKQPFRDVLFDEEGREFHLTLEYEGRLIKRSTTIDIRFDWVATLESWSEPIVEKILSMNLEGLHDEESILKLISKSYLENLSSLLQSQRKEFQFVEKYILSQENIPLLNNNNDNDNENEIQQNLEQEFEHADLDGDGTINREEWRRWMLEKEEIIKKSNIEKSKLVQENQNLRKALNSSTLQIFNDLQTSDERITQLQSDLADARIEIDKLKLELSLCYQQFHEADLTGRPPSYPHKSPSSSNPLNSIFPNLNGAGTDVDHGNNSHSESDNDSDGDGDDDSDSDSSVDSPSNRLSQYDLLAQLEKEEQQEEQQRRQERQPHQQQQPQRQRQPENKTNTTPQFKEVDLTLLSQSNPKIETTQQPLRRNSLDIVKNRPLQIRTSTKSSTPPTNNKTAVNQFDQQERSHELSNQHLTPERHDSHHDPIIPHVNHTLNNDSYHEFNEIISHFSESTHDTSSSFSSSSHPQPLEEEEDMGQWQGHGHGPGQGEGPSPSPWIHEYITTIKERNHSIKNEMLNSNSNSNDNKSPLLASPHLSNLPPAINETFYSPDQHYLKSKKSLCRETLLQGREHGLFNTSSTSPSASSMKEENEIFYDGNDTSLTGHGHGYGGGHEKSNKKLHPLHRALKSNSSLLSVPTTVYTPNISKLTSSPPSHQTTSAVLMKSKSFSRESQRTLPVSQRYLIGVTTASVGKTKKNYSSQLGAIRGTQEWK